MTNLASPTLIMPGTPYPSPAGGYLTHSITKESGCHTCQIINFEIHRNLVKNIYFGPQKLTCVCIFPNELRF